MQKDELKALFDQQASSYDKQWARMSPIRNCLHFVSEAVLARSPEISNVLCVGVGTGEEISFLANRFPSWRFMALDPSGAMIDVCRTRAEKEGYESRCTFHQGYLESLPESDVYDVATGILVSQFLLDSSERMRFFSAIAQRLAPGGVLVSADLAANVGTKQYEILLHAWLSLMASAGVQQEVVERARAAYAKDVAILPAKDVAGIIEAAGFESPVQIFQAGLMHAWFSVKASRVAA